MAVFGVLVFLLLLSLISLHPFVNPDETSGDGFVLRSLAFNRRLLTITSFRIQYAVAVTLVRNWVPIFVGVSVAHGGLAASAFGVGLVVSAEKSTKMLCQPRADRLSVQYSRAGFVLLGKTIHGLIAVTIPFIAGLGPSIGTSILLPFELMITPGLQLTVLLKALFGISDSIPEQANVATFAD